MHEAVLIQTLLEMGSGRLISMWITVHVLNGTGGYTPQSQTGAEAEHSTAPIAPSSHHLSHLLEFTTLKSFIGPDHTPILSPALPCLFLSTLAHTP